MNGADVRQFAFEGSLVALCDKVSWTDSHERHRYVARGKLKYVGLRQNGQRCEVPIDQEPADVAYRFANTAGTVSGAASADVPNHAGGADGGGDGSDDDNSSVSSGSQAEEVEDPDAVAARRRGTQTNGFAQHQPHQNGARFTQRKVCMVTIRDTGRIILPHVGMRLRVYLQRAEPLTEAQGSGEPPSFRSYRQFVYDVVGVSCIHPLRNTALCHSLLEQACTPSAELFENDVKQGVLQNKLFELGTRKDNSIAAQRQQKMMRELTGVSSRKKGALSLREKSLVQLGNADERVYSALPLLMHALHGLIVPDIARIALHALVKAFAASFPQTLCIAMSTPSVAYRFGNNLALIVKRLGLHTRRIGAPRLVATSSYNELAAVMQPLLTLRDVGPHRLIFFSGMSELPLWYAPQRVMMHYDGMPWNETIAAKTTSLAKRMTQLVERHVPLRTYETARVSVMARWLLDVVQRRLRAFSSDTMFDVTQCIEYAAQRDPRLRALSNRDAPLLHDALSLLLACGILHSVPRTTVDRVTSQNSLLHKFASLAQRRRHSEPLLFCTRRQWLLSSRLIGYARQLGVALAQHVSGSYVAQACARHTLYIHCGTAPRFLASSASTTRGKRAVVTTTSLSLYNLLAHTQAIDNDALYTAELMTYDEFVLYDAHLLDEHTLLHFLHFMRTHSAELRLTRARRRAPDDNTNRASLTLLGDRALPSPFASLWAIRRHRHLFAPSSRPASDNLQPLRHACATAQHEAASINALRAALHDQRLLSATAAFTLEVGAQRRWILCTANRKETLDAYGRLRVAVLAAARTQNGESGASNDVPAPPPGWSERARALARVFKAGAGGDTDLLKSHILYSSPFIGLTDQRVCVRVSEFRTLQDMPGRDETILPEHSKLFDAAETWNHTGMRAEALSLDNDLLLLVLAETATDHRVCCHTWHRNVMHVVRHRGDVVSQSFVTARDALPCAETAAPIVLFGDEYRFPDLYGALVRASPAVTERLRLIDFNGDRLAHQVLASFPRPNSFLADLAAT